MESSEGAYLISETYRNKLYYISYISNNSILETQYAKAPFSSKTHVKFYLHIAQHTFLLYSSFGTLSELN